MDAATGKKERRVHARRRKGRSSTSSTNRVGGIPRRSRKKGGAVHNHRRNATSLDQPAPPPKPPKPPPLRSKSKTVKHCSPRTIKTIARSNSALRADTTTPYSVNRDSGFLDMAGTYSDSNVADFVASSGLSGADVAGAARWASGLRSSIDSSASAGCSSGFLVGGGRGGFEFGANVSLNECGKSRPGSPRVKTGSASVPQRKVFQPFVCQEHKHEWLVSQIGSMECTVCGMVDVECSQSVFAPS